MLTPLDLLIGPALRHPQGPHEGEVPGSNRPYEPLMTAAGALAAVLALGWGAQAIARRIAGPAEPPPI